MNNMQKIAQNSRVAVVGAGISGLTFAYFLGKLRPDVRITVFERGDTVGGYIVTRRANADTIKHLNLDSSKGNLARTLKMEKGPRTLRGVSSGTLIIIDLMRKIGMLEQLRGVHVSSEGNKKYIMKKENAGDGHAQVGLMRGKLMEVPGPGCKMSTMFNFMASRYGKIVLLAILSDIMFKKDGKDLSTMSVEEFFTRHFGKPMIDELASALIYGIYAADVADLNASCVMPKMTKLEAESESGSLLRTAFKRSFAKKEDKSDASELDPDVKLYTELFGTDFDLSKLSVLLKRFPMLALNNGLSQLCYGLATHMPTNVEIISGADVKKIGEHGSQAMNVELANGMRFIFDHVRSTIGTQLVGEMIGSETELGTLLSAFPCTSVTVCNVLIPQRSANVKSLKGFGFLVPKAMFDRENRLMGVIFDSDIEEHSSVMFPAGEVPPVLQIDGHEITNVKEVLRAVEESVAAREGADITEECTKLTFMMNVPRNSEQELNKLETPTSELRLIVGETIRNMLGAPTSFAGTGNDFAIESATCWGALPLFDSQFPARRGKTLALAAKQFGNRFSLGGTSFAPGVGVPDGVVGSLHAAHSLAV